MASSREIRTFYERWFPIIHSFSRLFLGSRPQGTVAAIEAFSEYMRTGLPYEVIQMPLVLWECAVESALNRQFSSKPLARTSLFDTDGSKFDKALMFLSPQERLVFLLHTVYGLTLDWIELTTGWPGESVAELCEASRAQMRRLLNWHSDPTRKADALMLVS